MTQRVAVVIPYYHDDLEWFEKIGLNKCFEILGEYPIILLVPSRLMELVISNKYPVEIMEIPDEWLISVASYNKVVMTREFYNLFTDYEYILIYQLDAIVFSDQLENFCKLNYDYIGAPWLQGSIDFRHLEPELKFVGNGGFSLRRVTAFLKVIDQEEIDYDLWTEDLFWSSQESNDFKVAPVDVALTFAFETQIECCYHLNQERIPFGCHAWYKYDLSFWNGHCELQIEEKYLLKTCYNQGKENSYEEIAFLRVTPEITAKWFDFHSVNQVLIYGSGYLGNMCSWILRYIVNPYVQHISDEKDYWGQSFVYDRQIRPIFDALKYNNSETIIIIAEQDIENKVVQLRQIGITDETQIVSYIDLIKEFNYLVLH